MSLDEGVSRFIGRLYEAVYEPDSWRCAMSELMARTESRAAFVTIADIQHREYSRSEFYGPETSGFDRGRQEYFSAMYYTDPSLIWASRHPAAGVCDTSEFMDADDFRRLEYVKWQESRFATRHWRVFYTTPVDGLSFALSLHPPASAGPASRQTSMLHKLLFEHMERALRLATRPPDFAGTDDPVIVLDAGGRVLSMSPRAEELVRSGDGLAVDEGRLKGSSAKATEFLHAAVRSGLGDGILGGAGCGVRLSRPSGKADWFILVTRWPRRLDHLPVPSPTVVLRILESNPAVRLASAHAEMFGLSPRELEVANALLRRHSLESLGHSFGISRNTAKAHLQSLFRKTGTNRQSELVQLLSQLTR